MDANDTAISADPVGCPNSRRKLRVGEALPYHKIDFLDVQISDSYPIADTAGVSRGVQTYFYASEINDDPLFPGMVNFNAEHGGYNILGADAQNVFFRGTFDPSGGWQPWWTSDCRAAGWKLFPNSSAAFAQGGSASPTTYAPACPGQIATSAATVDWDWVPSQTYATGKTMDTIRVHHFAPNSDAVEVNYFTREYGVTRWEAWRLGTGQTPQLIKDQCPNSLYDAQMRKKAFYLADCHDWSKVVPLTTPWQPAGVSPVDSRALTWPVDPLYTSRNHLANTHVGGPYAYPGSSSVCQLSPWTTINPTSSMTMGWLAGAPWSTNGNCTMTFKVSQVPNGEVVAQTIPKPNVAGALRYGAMMFAPDWQAGQPKPAVQVQVIERDSTGALTGSDLMTVELTNQPQTFQKAFTPNANTDYLIFALYPLTANSRYAATGAYVAK
ncbi:hypothetical protein [Brevundimonas faecalis]|uniref:hypothetical protein n=1 Tax=Brevundimonas faecalis TaxID=947378 RepID=UPI003398CE05